LPDLRSKKVSVVLLSFNIRMLFIFPPPILRFIQPGFNQIFTSLHLHKATVARFSTVRVGQLPDKIQKSFPSLFKTIYYF